MSFNYAKSALTARKLLANFGQAMTLTKEVYNIDTGALTSATTTTDKGVIFAYSAGVVSMSNGLIQASDQQVYINISVVPAPADRLTVGAKVYSIVNVEALEPAGLNVLYILQVRS
jgi:hypothetical protein